MKKSLLVYIVFVFSIQGFAQNIGQTTMTFVDASRNNRSIPCDVYYPGTSTGTDVLASDPASFGLNSFPAIAVGHGFVIGAGSYELIANQLVPFGFVVALVNTEGGFAPSHEDFGLDLAFVTHALQQESLNSSSILSGVVNQYREAIVGHSMGGGAAWLAAASDPSIDAIVGLAPAETNPSAIAAAASVQCNAMVFSGTDDTVTPPADNHQPIYDGTNSWCKTFVSLTGGSHCGYINAGTLCDFGEPLGGSLARADQQDAYLNLMSFWLRHFLNDECVENDYSNYVTSHAFVVAEPLVQCLICENVQEESISNISVYPNPNHGLFSVKWKGGYCNKIQIVDASGRIVIDESIVNPQVYASNQKLAGGVYWLKLIGENTHATQKIIVE